MRILSSVLAANLLLWTPTALGQAEAPVAASPAPRATAAEFGVEDRSKASIELGIAQLEATRKAYRDAKALTETVKVKVSAPGEEQSLVLQSAYEGKEFRITIVEQGGNVEFNAVDGSVYMSMPSVAPDRYISQKILGGMVVESFAALTGGGGVPDPALPLRLGAEKIEPEKLASLLSMGSLPDMMLQGFQKTPHGPRLLLGAQDGQSVVTLDGDTGLIRRIDTAIKPASMPIEVNLELVIDSKVMDELPADQAIAFDPAGKTKVDGINDLLPAAPGTPKGLAIGDPAPAFDLESLDGSKVSLASLEGSVVVLDFWATWCGPCRAGMPAMAELAEWAASEGEDIKVFAINVGETRQKAASYWEREKFGFPTLLDPTSAAAMAYGASSIPLTVVIDPEGRVAKVEVGLTFDPRSEASRKAHLAKMQESLGKLLPKGG